MPPKGISHCTQSGVVDWDGDGAGGVDGSDSGDSEGVMVGSVVKAPTELQEL